LGIGSKIRRLNDGNALARLTADAAALNADYDAGNSRLQNTEPAKPVNIDFHCLFSKITGSLLPI